MKVIRKFLKILHFPIKFFVFSYLSKKRTYKYKGIILDILPGVFHPGLFHSTKTMLHFLDSQHILNNKVLEIGCGSGILSIYAAKKGGIVTAVDINGIAVENTILNASKNNVSIHVVKSDLLNDIHSQIFDKIFINPPYYPKNPTQNSEYAWYCGENFIYFHRLFKDIKKFINENTELYLVLSDDCDLKTIFDIAIENNFSFIEKYKRKVWGEKLFIYQFLISPKIN